MPWLPGCPQDQVRGKGVLSPVAVVLHRTYGQWPGDYAVIKRGTLAHFLVGKDPGQWVQFVDSGGVTYHCNGANFMAVGIELTGVNEDVLTPWQADRLGDILIWLNTTHWIPLVYTDPSAVPQASVWVNGGQFHGAISHYSVRTDDGSSQHTDLVTSADYMRATGGATSEGDMFTMTQMDTLGQWEKDTRKVILDTTGQWLKEVEARLKAYIDAKFAAVPPGGGLSEDQVRAVVREELDRTKLAG